MKVNIVNKINILIATLAMSIAIYFLCKYFGYRVLGDIARMTSIIIFIVLYCIKIKKSSRDFWLMSFLILYAIAYFFAVIEELIYFYNKANFKYYMNFMYLIINITYIFSYAFLSIGTFLIIDKKAIKAYRYTIIASVILIAIFTLYVSTIIDVKNRSYLFKTVIINTYNFMVLILFFISAFNYLVNESKKSFYLLLGSLFISVSVMLQIIYYYVNTKPLYSVFCLFTSLLILGFYFIWQQILENSKFTNQ